MSDRQPSQYVDRAPEPISKSTGAFLSIGMIISLIIGASFATRQWNASEERGTAMAAQMMTDHTAMNNEISRNTRRFNAYSGREGSNTTDIERLAERIEALEKELSVLHGKSVGR